MRRLAVAVCLLALIGCAPSDQPEAAETMETAAPAALTLADFAGTWSMSAMAEGSDSVLVTYQLVASSDPNGWTLTFPDREPIPARVTLVDGDSIVLEVGPYPSALRDAVNVSTRTVARLVDGQMVGAFVARYETTGPDSVLRGRQMGSRMQ